MADGLLYETKIPEKIRKAFTDKVIYYSQQLKIDPNWLMLVMNAESGMNSAAVNPKTNATGLIQFMPSTAKGLGVTVEMIKLMAPVNQLYYVYKYIEPYTGTLKSFYDLYLIVFFPLAVGKPSNWVMQSSTLPASLIYDQNPAIAAFAATPGQITVADFKKYTDSKLDEATLKTVKKTSKILQYLNTSTTKKVLIIGGIPVLAGIYLIFRKKINALFVR